MRIISGKFRGSNLYLPKDKNTRPLKDLVRESIFNLLTHSNNFFFEFQKSIILDLFSGSGSFGLECLSRECKNVYFVEKEINAIKILEKNIEKLKIKNGVKTFNNDIYNLIGKKNVFNTKFDLIFCDPPFKDKKIETLIKLIFEKNLLKKDAIIILHRSKTTKDKFPKYFELVDERLYGISKIIFGKFSL